MEEFIERLALDVIEGRKTLLQIERHLRKQPLANVEWIMKRIQEAVSRRKKGHV